MKRLRHLGLLFLFAAGCRSPQPPNDRPRLPTDARMMDFTLSSTVLGRDMPVRMIVPATPSPNAPVVYLLHGAGATYRDWSNESAIADLASHGIVLVMPDAGESYYVNDARGVRYEDYFFRELIPAVHRKAPYASTASARTAIVGISRGGFGAAVYALKHPAQFSYVGGYSSAFDLADRSFRWRAPMESLGYRKVFGARGALTRTTNDPNLLVTKTTSGNAPYFYLLCGEHDVLLPANQRFAALLDTQHLPHEFHILPGDHNWSLWGPQVPALEASLLAHFGIPPEGKA